MGILHVIRGPVWRRSATMLMPLLLPLCAPLVTSTAAAQESTFVVSRTDSTYLAYMREIFHLSRALGDSIWPGLDYNRVPILLYRPDSIAFLFNHPNPPPEFEPAIGLPWAFQNPVYVHRGRVGDLTGQFWTEMDFNGQATFVCPYDDDSTREGRFFRFVAHEAFHTFQAMMFRDRADTDEKLYPITIVQNNTLATLENLILAKAVDALIVDDRDEVLRRARQFVIVRDRRLKVAPPFVREHEQSEERKENTAFYVEKRCEEAGRTRGYAPTEFRRCTRFDPYHSHKEVLQTVHDGILEHLRGGAIAPVTMPRLRIYDNGAAVGYLLDYLGADWKGQATADSSFLFHGTLEQSIGPIGDADSRRRELAAVEQEFAFAQILTAAAANIDDHNRQIETLARQIRSSGRIAYRIAAAVKRGVSKSSASSHKVLYSDAGQTALYEQADRFLVKTGPAAVTVRGRGLIYSRAADGKTITVEVFMDVLPSEIVVDGHALPHDAETHAIQDSLRLTVGDELNVTGAAGTLTISRDTVFVAFQ
ncbi:MAG: hypothetical protein AB1792_11040 [Candidatus Zixiibacteriota bacterium]